MGTAGYLAPEQAKGLPADARSDVFAVGVVLYEMLSGQRPFRGDTHAEAVAAVLKEDPPDLVSPNGSVPPALDRVVRRCLEKDPEDRFQSARDVGFALDALSGTSGVSELGPDAQRWPRSRRRWAFPAAALVRSRGAPGRGPGRPAVAAVTRAPGRDARHSQPDRSDGRPADQQRRPAPHPHGSGAQPGRDAPRMERQAERRPLKTSALYLRRLDTGDVTQLPGTKGATRPFFSPDGRWIGFYVVVKQRPGSTLRKVPVGGGLVVDLAELSSWPMGVSWAADGRIYLGSETRGCPAGTGRRRPSTVRSPPSIARARPAIVFPRSFPMVATLLDHDGARHSLGVKARIEAVRPRSGERKVVVEDGADARYLPTGHLVFARQGVVMAAPFDLERAAR